MKHIKNIEELYTREEFALYHRRIMVDANYSYAPIILCKNNNLSKDNSSYAKSILKKVYVLMGRDKFSHYWINEPQFRQLRYHNDYDKITEEMWNLLQKVTEEEHVYSWEDIRDNFVAVSTKIQALIHGKYMHFGGNTPLIDLFDRLDWTFSQVKNLMESGNIDVNAIGEDGNTALAKCVDRAYYNCDMSKEEMDKNLRLVEETVDYLLSLGADIDLFGFDGQTPLESACISCNPDLVIFMLERGANPAYNCGLCDSAEGEIYSQIHSTVLHVVELNDNTDWQGRKDEVISLLKKHGARPFMDENQTVLNWESWL